MDSAPIVAVLAAVAIRITKGRQWMRQRVMGIPEPSHRRGHQDTEGLT
jgi:hypothetical protein